MNKQMKIEVAEENEETFDYSNFDPSQMLTNKQHIYSEKFNYSIPPDEDFLTNNTLWPETNKLYGHGYEIISVAASHDGSIIASGGKAQSEKHSKLFLWNTKNNTLISKLEGHTLTIVQIEFSKDDKYILSVSRDRSWCLYERDSGTYKLVQMEKEAHARIIWGCSWTSDSSLFITGSRDKFVKIWAKDENQLFKSIFTYEFNDSVTSCNFIPEKINDYHTAIIGFEAGNLELYAFKDNNFKQLIKVHEFLCHGASVKRIKSFIKDEVLRFATCSEDYSTRIFDIKISQLKSLINN
jgi:elongator complex protein 2